MDTEIQACIAKNIARIIEKKTHKKIEINQATISHRDRTKRSLPFMDVSPLMLLGITSTISGSVRHRLSVGSASGLSCGGEKHRDTRTGRASDGRIGIREREDDTKSAEYMSRGVLPSRQSLLDLVSGKFMGRHTPTHHYYHHQQQQVGLLAIA